MTSTIDHLRAVPLFTGMSDRALEAIAALAEAAAFADGSALTRQGEPGDAFYVIVEGTVQISRDDKPIGVLGGGGFIGEIALVDGRNRTATAMAAGAVEALVISREAFQALMDRYAAVRLGVLMALTDRIRSDERTLAD